MKTVLFSKLQVRDFFYARIAGNPCEEAHALIHAVNITSMVNREKYAQEPLIRMVKTAEQWATVVGEDLPLPLAPIYYVLVPEGEPKTEPGCYLERFRHDPLLNFDFATALALMTKKRLGVRRERWVNGEVVYLTNGSCDFKQPNECDDHVHGVPVELFDRGDTGTTTRLPNFVLANAYGRVNGWSPTAHDMLANDWHVSVVKG